MPSTHSTASILVHQQRLFDNITSFRELEQRIQALHKENTKAVGDAFEIFIEGYLATQIALQAEKVWLVGQVPAQVRQKLNLPADAKGIDGIFQTHGGELVPYQVKFRTERGTLNFTEVAPFLAVTERAKDRILFTNASALATDAANRDALRVVRRADFHQLTETDFQAIEAWLKELPPPGPALVPRAHQREAIEQITAALSTKNRTTAVMACGSGKTLVALWVAEAIKPKSVLVLVPSLSLLSQTLREWCRANPWGSGFNFLCVCSDPTVSRGTDEIILHKTETPFRIDTDPQVVRDFLTTDFGGVRVVFSTYQSVRVVADGACGLPSFDLGIFDEAHKTTGPHGGIFAYALNDNNVPIGKRLFLTATPRHYDINRRDREGDFKIVSMDDETVYGKVSYKLPFAEAARRDIICSYRILITVITTDELNAYLLDHGITLVDGDKIRVRWVANQIALQRAIEQTGVSKIITFHSRVRTAQAFVEASSRGIARHISGFSVLHVNGEQTASVRDDALDAFRNAGKALIANARCLTEGVDVPAVDMVAFIDPRKSRVDIAQAAGRAMRKAPNKTVGYVVIPLFLEQAKGQSIEEALERADFAEVANVVNAMREQDDLLIDIIRELRESKGRGEVFNPRRLKDSVEVIGPAIALDVIADAIDIRLIERLGNFWDEMFGRLTEYKHQHGDCLVPQRYIDKQLAAWVSTQRTLKNQKQLAAERIQRLDELGFVWNPHESTWNKVYGRLVAYKQRHGDCMVSRSDSDNELGTWVSHQRMFKTRGKLEPWRQQRLEELGFVWDPISDNWENMFGRLAEYKKQHGDCLVPASGYSDKELGIWVSNQRTIKSRDKLDPRRQQRLEELGFVWDPISENWQEMFGRMVAYKQQHGDCRVPRGYSDKQLSGWVTHQRTNKNRGKLETERIERLEELGFVWDPQDTSWDKMYGRLDEYKQQHGDCLVSQKYSDKQLGNWVIVQRMFKSRGKLEAERIQRLEKLGFMWEPRDEAWEEMFGKLVAYKQLHGDVQVPANYSDKELTKWVRHQRMYKKRGKLEAERSHRLYELGFMWEPHDTSWNKMYGRLVAYKEQHGDCLVPARGYSDKELGTWVSWQRTIKSRDKLDPWRQQRLEELGFVWDPINENWEEMFGRLAEYKKQHGDCLVPARGYSDEELGRWVSNQRMFKNRGKLETERTHRLNQLGFVWDPIRESWEEMFTKVVTYKQKHGDCSVPRSYSDEHLTRWVTKQRALKKVGKLVAARVQRLEEQGFVWNPIGEYWEEMFARMVAYKQNQGDCIVPQRYTDKQLGTWVNTQRTLKNRGKLDAERIQRLNDLGFVWKA